MLPAPSLWIDNRLFLPAASMSVMVRFPSTSNSAVNVPGTVCTSLDTKMSALPPLLVRWKVPAPGSKSAVPSKLPVV